MLKFLFVNKLKTRVDSHRPNQALRNFADLICNRDDGRDETHHVQFEILLLAYELLHNSLEVSWPTMTTNDENIG